LASEVRKVRLVRGKPTVFFERIRGRRADALDATVYAFAAKSMLNVNVDVREDDLRRPPTSPPPPPRPTATYRSQWMER
jgi:phage terminase large subunit GpA-like protein